MNPMIEDAKRALRRRVRGDLSAMTTAKRITDSIQACARLTAQPLWEKAGSILFYSPVTEELDVWPLVAAALAAGKIVALPQFIQGENGYGACQLADPAADLQPGRL